MTTAERLASNPYLTTRELITVASTVKVIRRDVPTRDGLVFKYVVVLDDAVVNKSFSVEASKLQARHIRREIQAAQAVAAAAVIA